MLASKITVKILFLLKKNYPFVTFFSFSVPDFFFQNLLRPKKKFGFSGFGADFFCHKWFRIVFLKRRFFLKILI